MGKSFTECDVQQLVKQSKGQFIHVSVGFAFICNFNVTKVGFITLLNICKKINCDKLNLITSLFVISLFSPVIHWASALQ